MRIGVFSDSHGDISPALRLQKELGHLDCLFHLGDYAADAQKLQAIFDCPCYGVRGNCDFGSSAPLQQLVVLGGKRFLLLHGHQFYDRTSLLYLAEQQQADMALYGHTHVPELSADRARLILNPGSLSRPRGGSKRSCALVLLENDTLNVRFVNESDGGRLW